MLEQNPTRYLLDTNILSDLIRNPQGIIYQHIQTISSAELCTSIIVACELRYGAERKGSDKLIAKVELLLSHFSVLPFVVPADQHYADIRTTLEKMGQPIGHHDLLIAAQTRALNGVLVSHNLREFERVPGLRLENWL